MKNNRTSFTGLAAMLVLLVPATLAAEEFNTFEDAFRAGLRHYFAKRYSDAEQALLRAKALAPDVEKRRSTYNALSLAYQDWKQFDKLLTLYETWIEEGDFTYMRLLNADAARTLLEQNSKIDFAIEKYNSRLKANANDPAALNILTVIYQKSRPNIEQATLLQDRRDAVNRKLARKEAERRQESAVKKPKDQGWELLMAAISWHEAGERAKAIEVAKASATSPRPDDTHDQAEFAYFHFLGSTFLDLGEPELAITYVQLAIGFKIEDLDREDALKTMNKARAAAEKLRPAPAK